MQKNKGPNPTHNTQKPPHRRAAKKMSTCSSSSGEEDGSAEWKAAIDSVSSVPLTNSSFVAVKTSSQNQNQLKHYQIKAQKALEEILEKSIEVVSCPDPPPFEDSTDNGSGIQLFKHAPRGIVFDRSSELQGPRKQPRLLPGEEVDENSKKFKKQLESVAVAGTDILAAARDKRQKTLAKLERREAAAKAAAKREEERVAELKKIRGERWLPCMAKERLSNSQRC